MIIKFIIFFPILLMLIYTGCHEKATSQHSTSCLIFKSIQIKAKGPFRMYDLWGWRFFCGFFYWNKSGILSLRRWYLVTHPSLRIGSGRSLLNFAVILISDLLCWPLPCVLWDDIPVLLFCWLSPTKLSGFDPAPCKIWGMSIKTFEVCSTKLFLLISLSLSHKI